MANSDEKEASGRWVTSTEMAKLLKIKAPTLTRGAKRGRLDENAARKEDGRWRFHPDEALRQWFIGLDVENVRYGSYTRAEMELIQRRIELGAANPLEPMEGDEVDRLAAAADNGRLDNLRPPIGAPMSDARIDAMRERLSGMNGTQVKVAKDAVAVLEGEIKLAQLTGELLRSAEVYSELFSFGQRIRNRMDAVPARIVDELAVTEDRTERMRIIRDALDEALTELAETPDLKKAAGR